MMTEERIAKLTSAVYKVTDLFPEKEPLKFVVRRESLDVLFSFTNLSSKPNLGQKEKFVKKAIASSRALIHYFDLAESQNWADPRNFSILKAEYSDLIFGLQEQVLTLEIEAKNTLSSIGPVYEIDEDLITLNESKVVNSSALVEKREYVTEKEGFLSNGDGEVLDEIKPKNGVKIKKEVARKNLEIEPKKEKEKTFFEIKPDVVINYEELSSIQLKTLEILQNKGFLRASQISKYFEDTSERSVRREIKELKDKSIIVAKGSGRSTFYEINHVY
ncbi:hypothetical protein M0R01_00515 [bacterium]|nr:hypothetical protein [bacterium]